VQVSRLSDPSLMRLFLAVLKTPEAQPLRDHLMTPSGRQHLITAAFALQPVSDR
jgi:hypothetical protein